MEKQASVIAWRKDQVRANLINLTRSNFFCVISRPRYKHIVALSTTIHDSWYSSNKYNINSKQFHFHSSKHRYSNSSKDIIARIHDSQSTFDRSLLIEINSCTFLSKQGTVEKRTSTIPRSKNIGRGTKVSRKAKKLRKPTRFSDRFREAFPVSWPPRVRRRRSEKPKQPTPGWKRGFLTPSNSRGFAQRVSLELWLLRLKGKF